MNFSKLPKNKRNQLIMVALLTVIALGGLGFGLIKRQYAKLRELAEKQEDAEKKFTRMTDAINRAEQTETEFNAKNKTLAEQEDAMASGDHYSWVVNSLGRFKLPYKVEIPQILQPTPPADVNLLPKFPYKQVTVKVVGGTAYYHDFGKFIADFENQFPHARVLNLSLEPSPSVGSGEKEKLSFNMDIVTLVKPGASQ